ncbi:MAG: putative lipid II flippase FtsW [Patescibacteria group bacterium]|jgi:cell division protein FtsW
MNQSPKKYKESAGIDWYLIGAIWLLVIFGLVMVSSAGVAIGWQKYQDVYWHLKHQLLFGVLPGGILFLILAKIDYHRWEKYAAPLLFISILLLVLVFIPGIGAAWGTSHSWINIFGYSLQPSEIVKLTFLIYLAAWLSSKEDHHLQDLSAGFLPFVFILAVITALLVLEPDTGTMIIIVVMSLAVYFTAGGRWLHLSWLTAAGLAGLWAIVKVSPYRAARFTTFLHPELDPQGIGYQANQALLAIGSGGLFGRGYNHSRQKFAYLPEVTGDSIFAVVAEELGFILTVAIVAVYIFIAVRGFKLAAKCPDAFGRLLVVGIITWFITQAFVNIGAMLGVMPLTGIPLPFISYGGTALMMSLAAAGILANISKQVNN